MDKTRMGTAEAIMVLLTVIVIHSMLSLPKDILSSQKSASLLNIIYISIIALVLGYIIFRLFKNFPGMDIIDISEFIGGKAFKTIIGIIFIFYFLFSSSILLRNFCESLKIIYYPMTDIIFIIALFIISVCIATTLDFSATIKTNLIVLPIVLISIVFLFFANMNKFVPEKIFPILGDGAYNTFIAGLTNLTSFAGMASLYFIPPLLKEPEKFKKITLISIGLMAIYLLLSVGTLLFMFSFFVDIDEITPLYNATRYIEIGSFFQRLESVFLLIWILSFACYLSIAINFALETYKKITNISKAKPMTFIGGLLIFGMALIPRDYADCQVFEKKYYRYVVFSVVFVLGFSLLIIANIAKKTQKKFARKES
ncbi:MAG: GerAB/ArcD/ProY family transporter [Clostridia bacterium]|nr:GerAB/ArcD/ProY family transporter [Clostridia bacterium]